MNQVFRQVWPLIKHKVKDPDNLLKGIVNTQISEADGPAADSAEIENLKAQISELSKS